jgi:hypothetical protein
MRALSRHPVTMRIDVKSQAEPEADRERYLALEATTNAITVALR